MAQAANFYEPCAPPRTVHLSTSMITLHWLSDASVEGASMARLSRVLPSGGGLPDTVAQAFATKAHADLAIFLPQRTAELAPGGEGVYLMVGGDGPTH